MTPKTFVGWASAATVTVITAIALGWNQPAISTVSLTNDPAFPTLREKGEDVAKITITSSENSFSLARNDEGGWIAPDRDDYPVAPDKIRNLIVTMTDMKLIEPKTMRSDRFARLEVEDVGQPEDKSRKVRIESADGDVIAETIIGKTRYRMTAGEDYGTYIRPAGEDRAWLANGQLRLEAELTDWLAKDIVDIESDRVKSVEIARHDEEPYEAMREDKDAAFVFDGVPEGRTIDEGATGSLANLLASVSLEDVKRQDSQGIPAERHAVTVETFSGVQIKLDIAEIDDKSWTVVSAAYVGEATDDNAEQAETAKTLVDEINARTEDRTFQIADHVASRLTKPIDDFLVAEAGRSSSSFNETGN